MCFNRYYYNYTRFSSNTQIDRLIHTVFVITIKVSI